MIKKPLKFDSIRPKSINLHFIVPPIKLIRRRYIAQLVLFVISAIGIISILQGGLYLSSAHQAQGEILGAATTAYADLNNASKNLSQQNLSQALELFASASKNVKTAQDKLDEFKALTWITPQGNSADHVLAGAGYLASAGEKLTSALDIFAEFKVSSQGIETENLETKLIANKQVLIESRDLIYKSGNEFDLVKNVPLDYEETLNTARSQIKELGLVLDKLIGLENLYLGIFGEQKTYLLIFQNYDEQRATGGFIGTFGVLKTDHGRIKKLDIDSIYDLDGKIYEPIAAPGPMQPSIPRWGIRDANWFADFPTSAKKLLYFFEKGAETADGVISLTPKVLEDLLRLVGPIEMPQYEVTLTPDNFQEVVQYKTSVDYDRKLNEPKKLLADFAPILLDRLSNLPKEQWLNFFQIMQDNLNQRHILIYSKDQNIQKTIDELGFSGKILPSDYDYLSIINSNLGGTKTDLEMETNVRLKSKILSDGSIMNTLTINRKNTSPTFNKDYMRILVPLGSEFVSVVGFDDQETLDSASDGLRTDSDLALWDQGVRRSNIMIRTEAGKTEFSGWLNTTAAEEKTVTLTYILPFKVNLAYGLLFQKQAGTKAIHFEGSLWLGKYQTQWTSNGIALGLNSADYNSNSTIDDFWGIVFN